MYVCTQCICMYSPYLMYLLYYHYYHHFHIPAPAPGLAPSATRMGNWDGSAGIGWWAEWWIHHYIHMMDDGSLMMDRGSWIVHLFAAQLAVITIILLFMMSSTLSNPPRGLIIIKKLCSATQPARECTNCRDQQLTALHGAGARVIWIQTDCSTQGAEHLLFIYIYTHLNSVYDHWPHLSVQCTVYDVCMYHVPCIMYSQYAQDNKLIIVDHAQPLHKQRDRQHGTCASARRTTSFFLLTEVRWINKAWSCPVPGRWHAQIPKYVYRVCTSPRRDRTGFLFFQVCGQIAGGGQQSAADSSGVGKSGSRAVGVQIWETQVMGLKIYMLALRMCATCMVPSTYILDFTSRGQDKLQTSTKSQRRPLELGLAARADGVPDAWREIALNIII